MSQALDNDGALKPAAVSNAVGVPDTSNIVTTNTAQTITAAKTFTTSPIVPNPTQPSQTAAAASIGEVQDLIAAEPGITDSADGRIAFSQPGSDYVPALSPTVPTYRSLNPKVALFPVVSNSTTETSFLDAQASVPARTLESVWRITVTGNLTNNSGSPVTYTLRYKNITLPATWITDTVTLAASATPRPFKWEIVGEGNTLLSAGAHIISHLVVAAAGADPVQQSMGSGVTPFGADPQTWDLTAQMSVAHANANVQVYSAQMLDAFPEGA